MEVDPTEDFGYKNAIVVTGGTLGIRRQEYELCAIFSTE